MTTRIVVLAGGKGERMAGVQPKVLTPLCGKPIMGYLLESIAQAGIDAQPVVVVGHRAEEVQKEFGPRYIYVPQHIQLGTGHAVQQAESVLKNNADTVLVLYGDHPFLSHRTIKTLHELHEREGRVLTMMTITVPDFNEWRQPFFDFGRIVRDEHGRITRIVEKKDALPAELEIRELNPSFFCFNAEWLWRNLQKLTNQNAQGEYYLTDLVQIAIREGESIASMPIEPFEAIGVNTPEHLALASALLASRLRS